LILLLCRHSLASSTSAAAIARFCNIEAVPESADSRASVIFAKVLEEMLNWSLSSNIATRHKKWCEILERHRPDVATFVEYDAVWRSLPLPAFRPYSRSVGRGGAVIVFDCEMFDQVTSLAGVKIPEQISADGAPKSSSVVLLRHRTAGHLCLIVAVHLESGPSTDSDKVRKRQVQTEVLLAEVHALVSSLSGEHGLVLIGGDFNALREEFVLGTGDEFFSTAAVDAAGFHQRPGDHGLLPKTALASFGGRDLQFACPSVDGGWLREVSRHDVPDAEVASTKGGSKMVIDFILAGTFGARTFSSSAHEIASLAEQALAASSIEAFGTVIIVNFDAFASCGGESFVVSWSA